ncbi:MAG TPA: hypothetical protein PLS69_04935 [Terricaulis sp.]|nr:hypothetical protein [Terricaulis sp.]HRP12051.1 hypothetical protein [Terricaulis sp.]
MLKRSLLLLVCASALAACGPAAETQTAAAPRVSEVACEVAAYDEEVDVAALREVHFEGDEASADVPVGVMVQAGEGSSCTGDAASGINCQVRGPVARFAIQDWTDFKIPEGRTATLTYRNGEGSACFLNEEG